MIDIFKMFHKEVKKNKIIKQSFAQKNSMKLEVMLLNTILLYFMKGSFKNKMSNPFFTSFIP
jgi:hypothetical protein